MWINNKFLVYWHILKIYFRAVLQLIVHESNIKSNGVYVVFSILPYVLYITAWIIFNERFDSEIFIVVEPSIMYTHSPRV